MENIVIINGQKEETGHLIPDRGFQFGQGLFETILIKEHPVFLEEHCERLGKGLKKIKIKSEVDCNYLQDCIQRYKIKNCILKVIVTDKNIVLMTRASGYTPQEYEAGFSVKISEMKRNPYSHAVYVKSLNHLDNLIEREQALDQGYQEVLFFNTDNYLAEGSISNIFMVKERRLFTPETGCGILNGIVRNWITTEFNVCQARFTMEDLMGAEEVFLTNSVMGIMKVSRIGDVSLPACNTTYEQVRQKYDRFVSRQDA